MDIEEARRVAYRVLGKGSGIQSSRALTGGVGTQRSRRDPIDDFLDAEEKVYSGSWEGAKWTPAEREFAKAYVRGYRPSAQDEQHFWKIMESISRGKEGDPDALKKRMESFTDQKDTGLDVLGRKIKDVASVPLDAWRGLGIATEALTHGAVDVAQGRRNVLKRMRRAEEAAARGESPGFDALKQATGTSLGAYTGQALLDPLNIIPGAGLAKNAIRARGITRGLVKEMVKDRVRDYAELLGTKAVRRGFPASARRDAGMALNPLAFIGKRGKLGEAVRAASASDEAAKLAVEKEAAEAAIREEAKRPIEIGEKPTNRARDVEEARAALDEELFDENAAKLAAMPADLPAPKVAPHRETPGGRMGATNELVDKILRNREEWYQSSLGRERGTEAYYLEKKLDAKAGVDSADRVLDVNRVLADPETWRKAEKILGKRGASIFTSVGRQLPFIGNRFGITGDRMADLFKATEGVKEFDLLGRPVFGTMKKDGTVRYTAAQGKKMWDSLSDQEKRVVKWARNQMETEAALDGIEEGLEGYMRHYHPQKPGGWGSYVSDRIRSTLPGFKKERTEAAGFIQDFEKALKGRFVEGARSRAKEEFLPKFVDAVTDPVVDGKVKEGWVLIEPSATVKIPKEAIGRQIPAKMHDEFLRHAGALKDVSELSKIGRAITSYWTANVLVSPFSTPIRNIYSTALQYLPKLLDDAQEAIVTGNVKRFWETATSPIRALKPSYMDALPPQVFGENSMFAQNIIDSGQGAAKKAMRAALYPITAVDRWAKRSLAISDLRAKGVDPRKLRIGQITSDMDLFKIARKSADLYGIDYANNPRIIQALQKSPVGGLVVAFLSYPYGLARLMTHYIAAPLNPALSKAQKAQKIITLAAIMGAVHSIRSREHRTGEFVEGMDPVTRDKTGRTYVSTNKEGKEGFVRTRDLPWFNLHELGVGVLDIARGKGAKNAKGFIEEYVNEGPLLDGLMFAIGRPSKYEINTTGPEKLGRMAKTFIPGFRVTESIRRIGQETEVKPKGFWEEFARGIPGTPTMGTPREDRKGGARFINPSIEAMKFFLGINMKYIDPEAWEDDRKSILTRAINNIQNARNEFELDKAKNRLMEIDPEVARQLFQGVSADEIVLTPEKADRIRRDAEPDAPDAAPKSSRRKMRVEDARRRALRVLGR